MHSLRECSIKPVNGKIQQDIMHWQSDYSVVSKKFRNGNGEKGIAVMRSPEPEPCTRESRYGAENLGSGRRDARDTFARRRTGFQMETKLATLTRRAKRESGYKFWTLAHLLTEDFLKAGFWELKRDKATGIDRVSVKEYEDDLEANLKDLVARLKAKKYKPQPARRVYIPKSEGKKRGLGIPTAEDKIVQMGIKKILEAIFEVDFIDVSYGFRPNRSCHSALNVLDKTIMTRPINYVVDMDIRKFFDSINHQWLMRCLRQRIKDTSLLRLVARLLKAGIMEEGKFIKTDKGAPQGGILSPVLSNIYLHYILDLWFEKVIKKELKGYARLVRYADDFVVCFQIGSEAKEFGRKLKQRLDKFGLEIAENKSRIIEFGRYVWQKAQREGGKVATFDFLGFTHYCDKSRKGKFKLGQKTSRLKYRQKMKGMNEWLKKTRNFVKLKEWWKVFRIKLIGHYRYYGISGNMRELRKFYIQTSKLAYKWINRRSQKKSYTYRQYCRFKEYNPLPEPKIYHLTYTLFSHRGSITEEPCVGNPQARFCEGY
ncbi:MAG: group II intron reverse transcriptase/maturase [Thermodesulfobacteriota bacterium]|nr:group II intron reverse transcriptase/maturase [Thermodesulfobacteriota bacterium]